MTRQVKHTRVSKKGKPFSAGSRQLVRRELSIIVPVVVKSIPSLINLKPVPIVHKVGYSSHGAWARLKDIKAIELDRDNEWFDDSGFDLDNDSAIWVTYDPVKALTYDFSADLINSLDNPNYQPPDFLLDEWLDFKEALKEPLSHVEKVDLSGAEMVLEDGDGGYLYVKRKVSA